MFQATLLGRLGADAVVNEAGGRLAINFSVAHTEKYNSAMGMQEKTMWVKCVKWCELGKATVAQYMKKGDQILLIGTPAVSSYINREGINVVQMEMRVDRIELIGGNKTETPADHPTAEVPIEQQPQWKPATPPLTSTFITPPETEEYLPF